MNVKSGYTSSHHRRLFFVVTDVRSLNVTGWSLCLIINPVCSTPLFYVILGPVTSSDQNSARTSHLLHACYVSCPTHRRWFRHPDNVLSSSCKTSSSSLSLLGPQIILGTVLSDVLFTAPIKGRRVPMGALHANGKVI